MSDTTKPDKKSTTSQFLQKLGKPHVGPCHPGCTLGHGHPGKCQLPAPPIKPRGPCQLPPAGWVCTRGEGHDGACAAEKLPESAPRALPGMNSADEDAGAILAVKLPIPLGTMAKIMNAMSEVYKGPIITDMTGQWVVFRKEGRDD